MRFRRAVQRYGRTPEPETPYQRAGQIWDERIGSARVQARNWRLMAFGGLVLTSGLSAGLVWQSMQSRVVPYVVEVDALGEARAVAPIASDYRPTDPQIAWHLGRFIANIRGKSLDPVLMRENWLSAYDFASPRGAIFLGEYARSASPFADIGNRTVSVQVTSIVRASDRSFQIKWIENVFERGSLAGTSRWTAILTVTVKPPKDADTLRKNPLGLYVDAIDWSRELETTANIPTPSPPAPQTLPSNLPLGSPVDPNLLPSSLSSTGVSAMKAVLLAATVLVGAIPAYAQTNRRTPPGSLPIPAIPTAAPIAVAVPSMPPRQVHHQSKAMSPAVARVRSANRDATQEPKSQSFLHAMQIYPFSDGALYRLYAAPERVTDIVLQAGESVISVAAGDTVRWTVGDTTSGSGEAKRVHILVKPFASGLSTNLVITTDRRAYHLQLESTASTVMAALSWNYPQDELIAIRRAAEQEKAAAPVATGLAVEQLYFGYAITGDTPAWRPLRAFDDGRQTFIEFPPSIAVREAPPLFVVGAGGEAQLVNYRIAGRFYVVDRLFDAAELRLGEKKQAVVRIVRGGTELRQSRRRAS